MTSFYLTEIVWPADNEPSERPLMLRLVAECVTKGDCDRRAERYARSHVENGFDSSREAWWGKTGDRIHYYQQSTSRPGRLWNGMKPGTAEAKQDVGTDARLPSTTNPSTGDREEADEGPDDEPINREDRDTPSMPG
jgi:hypothetical protein